MRLCWPGFGLGVVLDELDRWREDRPIRADAWGDRGDMFGCRSRCGVGLAGGGEEGGGAR